MCTDQKKISDTFNTYFATICCENRPQNMESPYKSYLTTAINTKFEFDTITNDTTLSIIAKLKASHSCGHDTITNNIMKLIKHEISDCITLIVNQSITTGVYPDRLKLAKIVPIHKKGDTVTIKNYRPISILPAISKIFENVMHSQLMTYFTTNNLLTSQQYGFRPNLSTELAALELMDRNVHEMKEGNIPINIFLDLSKAFDSLDYDILLYKLEHYGLQENATKLMKSYLLDRFQYVQINNLKSSLLRVKYGIPQGSVMGPLLFNIFINDISHIGMRFNMIMYADDTTLISNIEKFGQKTNPHQVQNQINMEISNITKWLNDNELLLNTDKSKFMVFFKPPKKVPKLEIKINGSLIEQVTEFNFLGITLDQNITWKQHSNKIAIKISRVTGVMRKLQHVFPPHILTTIYFALIHSHLNYGLLLWGFKNMHIANLQKKAIRVTGFRPYIAHTEPIFKRLKILRLEDMYTTHLYKLYYRLHHDILPAYFECLRPTYSRDIQQTYNLRNNTVRLPMPSKEYFVRTAKYQFMVMVRDTPEEQLRSVTCPHIKDFIHFQKSLLLEAYDVECHIANCYVCANT